MLVAGIAGPGRAVAAGRAARDTVLSGWLRSELRAEGRRRARGRPSEGEVPSEGLRLEASEPWAPRHTLHGAGSP